MALWIYTLVQALAVSTSLTWGFLPDRFGNLSVNHEVAFIGDTLEFTCNVREGVDADINSTYLKRSDVIFKDVISQTNSSVTIAVPVTSLATEGYYTCHADTPEWEVQIGIVKISVDYPLTAPNNISCKLAQGLRFQCRVSLVQEFRHQKDIVVCIWYKIRDVEEKGHICRNSTLLVFEPGFDNHEKYTFVAQLKHRRRNVSVWSRNFSVDPQALVQPAPVVVAKWNDVTSRGAVIAWSYPDLERFSFKIERTSVWDTEEEVLASTNFTQFVSLTPSTDYEVCINVGARNSFTSELVGFWSYPKCLKLHTLDDHPAAAPEVPPAISTTTDGQGIVYFRPLSKKALNGPLVRYEMECSDNRKYANEGNATAIFVDLDFQSEQSCRLYAVNTVGRSPFRNVLLHHESEAVTVPQFWVTVDDTETHLTYHWKKTNINDKKCHVTLYRCQKHVTQMLCESPLEWLTVHCDLTNFTVNVNTTKTPATLMVGLSLELSNLGSSYVHWDTCTYFANKAPAIPSGFRLSTTPQYRSIHVYWDSVDCRHSDVFINSYIVQTCKVNSKDDDTTCTGPLQNETISGRASSYFRRDVNPQFYRVWLRAVGNGIVGPPTRSLTVQVSEDNSLLPLLSLLSLVIWLPAAAFGLYKCKKNCSKQEPVVVPFILNQDEDGSVSPDSTGCTVAVPERRSLLNLLKNLCPWWRRTSSTENPEDTSPSIGPRAGPETSSNRADTEGVPGTISDETSSETNLKAVSTEVPQGSVRRLSSNSETDPKFLIKTSTEPNKTFLDTSKTERKRLSNERSECSGRRLSDTSRTDPKTILKRESDESRIRLSDTIDTDPKVWNEGSGRCSETGHEACLSEDTVSSVYVNVNSNSDYIPWWENENIDKHQDALTEDIAFDHISDDESTEDQNCNYFLAVSENLGPPQATEDADDMAHLPIEGDNLSSSFGADENGGDQADDTHSDHPLLGYDESTEDPNPSYVLGSPPATEDADDMEHLPIAGDNLSSSFGADEDGGAQADDTHSDHPLLGNDDLPCSQNVQNVSRSSGKGDYSIMSKK